MLNKRRFRDQFSLLRHIIFLCIQAHQTMSEKVVEREPVVPILRFKVIEEIRMIETYMITNAFREITISHTMKKSFLLQTTTRTKSGLSNVSMAEQRESRHRVVTS